ncbi:hypothetical protein JTB14_030508 [Gonioctena quinquepunctata]|nr:hypothetical protein JTB14_030508 [Gonioctena quinquepunctata]
MKSSSEPDNARLRTINITEDAVVPSTTDNRPFVLVAIGDVKFHALLDTGATRSYASKTVGEHCIYLGLTPVRQSVTQTRQADGSLCAVTQASSTTMTIGQERFGYELLIHPHLTVDIVFGMDVLSSGGFNIQLTGNTVFINRNNVSMQVASSDQPLLTLQTTGRVERIYNN